MKRSLNSTEREELIKSHRKKRDKRICDRIKAVLLHDDGYSYSKIARILLIDDETVRRHIKDYFYSHKLVPENGGSTGYLSQSESDNLKAHLRGKTYLYVKDIGAYVKQTFGKNYSISGMTKWLCSNGFCYKKPHGVPAKAEKEKQEAFIEYYKALKASAKNNEPIYFADSSHPQHQTKLAYGWIEKGVRKAEKMTACQKRINLIGAINLKDHHVEYSQADWINAESIQAFLEQLIAANPASEKIHVILDNAGYHKSKVIKDFVSKSKITLHYLPPYSPNLNPIERLWKVMHEQATYNKYYEKFADFTEGVLGFFRNIEKYKSIIQGRINDNFQRLTFA